ncbi:MAG: hypothetical protein RL514_3509 [Verrucomicrobiota bacterium]
MGERIVRLETDHGNTVGWLKDIADRLKYVERQVWFAVGLLTALQLFLKFYKP